MLLLGIFLCFGLSAQAWAGKWDTTRVEQIDTLNSMLHRHWPDELARRDLDVLLRFYANETGTGLGWANPVQTKHAPAETTLRWTEPGEPEPIRSRYEKLLALFSRIDRAELRLERVDWRHPTPEGYSATVHVLVRGLGPDRDRRQLEQWATVRVRYFDPFWEITQEEVTGRTLVSTREPAFEVANRDTGIDDLHASDASPVFRLFGHSAANPRAPGRRRRDW